MEKLTEKEINLKVKRELTKNRVRAWRNRKKQKIVKSTEYLLENFACSQLSDRHSENHENSFHSTSQRDSIDQNEMLAENEYVANDDYLLNFSFQFDEFDIQEPNNMHLDFNLSADSETEYSVFEDLNENVLLYPNSDIHIKDFLMSLYAVKSKHKLSEIYVDDLLNLFKITLPQPNKCPLNSFSSFKNIFHFDDTDAVIYFSCVNCKKLINDNLQISDLKSPELCENCQSVDKDAFVVFDAERQIRQLLDNTYYLQQIIKFNDKLRDNLNSEDLTIGRIYSSLQKTIEYNYISLNINTDGAPLTSANNYSMWPVLATVVELEQKPRESFSNVLFLGSF